MKKIVTLLTASLASVALNAQITLNQSDYASWKPGLDSYHQYTVNPALSTNANWDFTVGSYTMRYDVPYATFSNSVIPNAAFTYEAYYGFSSSLSYQTRIAMNIDANGISELGEDIGRQAVSLQSFGLRPNDSAIFDAQTFAYSAPRKRLVFPVTAGSSWQSTLDFSTNYTLKLPYRPNPYLGRRITYLTQKDTVAGWGRMRIKVNNATTSAWMDVLAVKTRVELRDSFYIDGVVASSNFLTPFGLKQNMPDSTFKVQFYRKGEVSPLFTIEYNDANYTSVFMSAAHQNRIPANVGVNSVNAAADFKLYPNPSTAASGFDIELVETGAGSWSYNLLDASGKVVGAAPIQQTAGKAHVDAKTVVPGRYFLSISKDGRQIAAKPIVIGN